MKIYQMLDIIRYIQKEPGGKPDLHDPIVLDKGSTLEDGGCRRSQRIPCQVEIRSIWGSGKHEGVMVKETIFCRMADIIELHV